MSPRPIRRTQAISPFGIGAMVDFPGPVSLIHCGLDAWPFDENNANHREFRIDDEPRLAARLRVEYFVQPMDFRYPGHGMTSGGNMNLKLPFLRFPRWHVCPRCGLMYEAALHDKEAPRCEGPIGSGKDKGKKHSPRRTVQVRFVAACKRGHIQDFPWWEWVLKTPTPSKNGRLRMHTSGSASLAGVRISCEAPGDQIIEIGTRTLAGAFETGPVTALTRSEILCRGENPALSIPSATTEAPGCGSQLFPLLRGGSNVYFPHVMSAIYLPPIIRGVDEDILEILEDTHVWTHLSLVAQASPEGLIDPKMAGVVLKKYYPDRNVDENAFADAATKHFHEQQREKATPLPEMPEPDFRREEYAVLSRDIQEGYPKTNLLIRSRTITEYEQFIIESFQRISLVHRLRETRVFTGFSRIFPESELSMQEERALLSRTPKSWLPAVIVRGEGVFLQIREDKIAEWFGRNEAVIKARLIPLQQGLNQSRSKRHQEPKEISARFVMLHTLAHLIMNQLVYECGYGSASLRERLYCADGENPMAGILIYTAAGDSEGSMGGLVRMGNPGHLEGVVKRALEKARWCSTDPVCIESNGQGPDNCNLAACHSCALVPETSCEEQNRLLDRGMVVGTISNPEIGFFNL